MPVDQRTWKIVFGDQPPQAHKNVRTGPSDETDDNVNVKQPVNVDKARLNEARSSLAQQVQALLSIPPAVLTKQADNFLDYEVDKSKTVFQGSYSEIFLCTNNAQFGNMTLAAREYKPKALITADSLYLKILRRIGSECPNIIATMDVFVDEIKYHIFVFQEYANRGNGMDFIKAKNRINEKQMRTFARSLYDAMDYLGSIGVSHRAINPKHVMLCEAESVLTAKLSGLRDAVVYYDSAKNDIIYQPCKKLTSPKSSYYQAPEVFGKEGELYNPISADVFSLGVTLFVFIIRGYPFNPEEVPESGIDSEIRYTLASCASLSEGAKKFLFGTMRANTKSRTSFEEIASDAWFQE